MKKIQKEKLIEMAKQKLEVILLEDIKLIRFNLKEMGSCNFTNSELFKLEESIRKYDNEKEYFKNYYGVEFKDIQKQYERLLSKINECLF